MSKILKFFTTVRNNWKKTTFAVTALGYGVDFAYTEYEKNLLIRKCCKVAVQYGDVPLDVLKYPRHIAVILNPAANKRKAQKEYEKFCAPLLHLAGIKVTLLVTNKDSDAISMVSKIPSDANAILIAGGDGTVSEVITGLLRLKSESSQIEVLPVGIAPVGRTNSLANKLYVPNEEFRNKLHRFYVMMDATFSVIYEVTKKLSVMEIKNVDTDVSSEKELKPIYAVNRIHFGAFRDALARREKYWYFEKLRAYAVHIFGSFDRNGTVQATMKFTPPCSGCSKCHLNRLDLPRKPETTGEKRWWTVFIPRFQKGSSQIFIDYSKIDNPSCGIETEIPINSIEVAISPDDSSDLASLQVKIGPERVSYFEFVQEGWSRVSQHAQNLDKSLTVQNISARNVHFLPANKIKDEKYLSIDNEEFELKSIHITLLNKVLSIFQLPKLNKENS